MRRALACLLAAALTLAGCSSAADAPVPRLRIAAGQPGGVYYALGAALAGEAHRQWDIPVQVMPSNESVGNLRLVAEGKADVGFATVDVCALAVQGDSPFEGVLPLAVLAGIYEDYLQVVVRADSPVKTLKDLKGLRVSTGPPGSGTEIVANGILETVDLRLGDFEAFDLNPADAAQGLRIGAIDAFFALGGLPTPAVADLAAQLPIRVLSMPDEVAKMRQMHVATYLTRSIPVGVYGLDADVVTLGIPNALVVRADMPDETAFRLTQLLFAAKPQLVAANPEARRLDPHSAIEIYGLPLHRGAIRYYRSFKPMVT
jgi:TRAP transporter TAXI family solute receptor